jgi:hypothetical protein
MFMPLAKALIGPAPLDETTQREIKKVVREELDQRTIEPSPSEKKFLERTNALKRALATEQQQRLLEPLLKSMRAHCEPLLPMATGNYKSHGHVTIVPMSNSAHGHLPFEVGHEGGHVSGHGVHYLLHQLHHFHIIAIAETILSVIPFFVGVCCGLVKVFEIWKEHHVLEAVRTQLNKLNGYSPMQREALYEFVITRTLLTLKTELKVNSDTKAWHFLLLSQSLASLSELSEAYETLEAFGMAWSQRIIDQFKTYGVYMPATVVKYQSLELSSAYKVQNVFTDVTTEFKKKLSNI